MQGHQGEARRGVGCRSAGAADAEVQGDKSGVFMGVGCGARKGLGTQGVGRARDLHAGVQGCWAGRAWESDAGCAGGSEGCHKWWWWSWVAATGLGDSSYGPRWWQQWRQRPRATAALWCATVSLMVSAVAWRAVSVIGQWEATAATAGAAATHGHVVMVTTVGLLPRSSSSNHSSGRTLLFSNDG